MPAHKASNPKSKKSVQKAVSANMHELSKPGAEPRSQKQKVAIAFSEAKPKKKSKR